jgi:hypothetical protein
MLRRLTIASAVLVCLAVLNGFGTADQAAAPSAAPASQPTADLVVTLQHVGGKTEVFRDEVTRMELILDSAGRLNQVHLILSSGPEPDTHVWYNVSNLVSVRYQFLAITGKGRVSVRLMTPPKAKETADDPRKALAPLDPDDYR